MLSERFSIAGRLHRFEIFSCGVFFFVLFVGFVLSPLYVLSDICCLFIWGKNGVDVFMCVFLKLS